MPCGDGSGRGSPCPDGMRCGEGTRGGDGMLPYCEAPDSRRSSGMRGGEPCPTAAAYSEALDSRRSSGRGGEPWPPGRR
jgi:hypothetical protein